MWALCAHWMRTCLSPSLSHICFACKADTSSLSTWCLHGTVGAPVWVSSLWPAPASGQTQDNLVQLGFQRGKKKKQPKNLWGAGEIIGELTAKRSTLQGIFTGRFFFCAQMLKTRSGQKQMPIHPMPKFLQGICYIPEAILGSFYFFS